MNRISLRSWISAIIVMAIIGEVFYLSAPIICCNLEQSGMARETLLRLYFYLSTLLAIIDSFCSLMAGMQMFRFENEKKIAKLAGLILISKAIISILYAIPSCVAGCIFMVKPSIIIGWSRAIVLTLLTCSFFIVIARHYRKNDMLGMAITYTIIAIATRGHEAWIVFALGEEHGHIALCVFYSLLRTITGLICLCKWWKWEKLAETQKHPVIVA